MFFFLIWKPYSRTELEPGIRRDTKIRFFGYAENKHFTVILQSSQKREKKIPYVGGKFC